jgi:hypothetical protein
MAVVLAMNQCELTLKRHNAIRAFYLEIITTQATLNACGSLPRTTLGVAFKDSISPNNSYYYKKSRNTLLLLFRWT